MTPTRWLLTLLSFAATIGASAYVVATSWPAEGPGAIGLPVAAHALALLAAAAEIGARALKISLSARALHIPISFGASLRTCLGGDFASAVTPARSGSEPARFLVLREAGVTPAGALLVLFAELFLEMLSLALVAVALAALFGGQGAAMRGMIALVGGYAAFVLGVGTAGLALSRHNTSGPPPAWARRLRIGTPRWRAVQRALRQLRVSAGAIRTARPGAMLVALLASVAHVVARLAVLPALVLTVAPATALAPLVLWPLALQYGAVVAPAPGGGGFVEVAFKATLTDAIPAAIIGAALVWWRFYTFYLYILLGALAAGGTVLRALRGGGVADASDRADERVRRSA